MNIKLIIIKIKLEFLRYILHILLNFKNPTDQIVVCCSQQLDSIIVNYHKSKVALSNNIVLFNNTSNSTLFYIIGISVFIFLSLIYWKFNNKVTSICINNSLWWLLF